MAMDAFLAEYYGTNKTASAQQEDLEKQASVELFCKLAAEEKIDLKSLPDEKVQELYASWSAKVAAAAQPGAAAPTDAATKVASEEEEKKKREEEAKKEHEEKKAAAEKVAEAEFLGRVMAHSMVAEMKKIAADTNGSALKVAEIPEAFRAHMAGKGKEEEKGKEHEPPKHEEKKEHEHEDKKASAIDALAIKRAGELAKEAGINPEEATKKIAAAYTLNLVKESTKVAAAADVAGAVEVRALELLETAGYPVTWNDGK